MTHAPAAVRHAPQTRWCGPNPYAQAQPARSVESAARYDDAFERRAPWRRPTSSGEVLLAQLERELQRGHWRVALRHFLMLEVAGHEVPPALRLRCLEHARACSGAQWCKMEADVAAWARCLGGAGSAVMATPRKERT